MANAEALRAMVIKSADFSSLADAAVKKATTAFANAAAEIAAMDFTVIDDVFDLEAILATARAHAAAKPLDVLCVDYPALMAEALAQLKAHINPADTWRATVRSLDAALKPFYLQGRHYGCG